MRWVGLIEWVKASQQKSEAFQRKGTLSLQTNMEVLPRVPQPAWTVASPVMQADFFKKPPNSLLFLSVTSQPP